MLDIDTLPERTDCPPKVRQIFQSTDSDETICAYHITNAFSQTDLDKLNELRQRIPLDVSRPTCPRRFLTEKTEIDEQDANRQHREDGWVGALIDATVDSWNLPHAFASLPWYRFLEYTEPGGHMAKHTDGSNTHQGSKSVATMLLYLSTCREGGETTLYRKRPKKSGGKKKDTTDDEILESIRPVYNTVLIFPHAWPHSGDPVVSDPKIALRVDLTLKSR